MLGLVVVTAGVCCRDRRSTTWRPRSYFPVADANIDLHWFFYPVLFLVIAGTANGANLTDGLDGLLSGVATISLLALLAIAAIMWIRSSPEPPLRSDEYLDPAAIFAAALIGATIGFLW